MIENPKDVLAQKLLIFLEKNGLDPLYTITVFTLIIAATYRNYIKNWNKLEGWRKGQIIATVIAAAMFSIISFLRITNLINWE